MIYWSYFKHTEFLKLTCRHFYFLKLFIVIFKDFKMGIQSRPETDRTIRLQGCKCWSGSIMTTNADYFPLPVGKSLNPIYSHIACFNSTNIVKGHRSTFPRFYWWKETSGAPQFNISDTIGHLSISFTNDVP